MKPFPFITYIFLLMLFSGCMENEPTKHSPLSNKSPTGPFFGIDADTIPKVLLPGFISTRFGEYNGTFNPEGTAFYYTVSLPNYDAIIETTMLSDKSWSTPKIASFSGKHEEFDPLFSPDGKRLYYSSLRLSEASQTNKASTIWFIERAGQEWSKPQYVPLQGPALGNYYSSLTQTGTIYFNIWYTGNMFKAQQTEEGYKVEQLSEVINSEQSDGDPFIAPDESYLIFRSYRPGGFGNGDLYISYNVDKTWTSPQNLGAPINSEAREMCPYVTTNGKYFIFASRRMQSYYENPPANLEEVSDKYDSHDNGLPNIYYMNTDFIEKMRPNATK